MGKRDFAYYSECFRNLHTNKRNGYSAPHKPLLLLTIIDMIEDGAITSPRIELSDLLIATFNVEAKRYVGNSLLFKPDVGKPFYHMDYEPFWRLVPKAESVAKHIGSTSRIAADPSTNYSGTCSSGSQTSDLSCPHFTSDSKHVNYSIPSLRKQYDYALIDEDLFLLLLNNDVRVRFRILLISTYLQHQPSVLPGSDLMPLVAALLTVIA